MASGNIKGITIEFRGDTTQLGKALSQVNKEIRATDSALRDINKALKLDPNNVDLLAQKEGLLAKQIEQTKSKLDLQKQAAEEAAKALENGTISQEEYAKLSAELATTASKLDKLEDEANDAGDALTEAGGDAEQAANGGFTVLKGVLANLATEAINAAGAALKSLGSALVDVGKQAVDSYAEMEQLKGGVQKLFEGDANKVIENANAAFSTAGLNANDYMEAVTGFSASLISGLEGDTALAAEIADTAIRDMADNANTFGTDMSSVMATYQALAKGNMSLLDNLKLGYGGSAAEMARLVNESGILNGEMEVTAETVKDLPFDQLILAINKTQERLGIMGATADEAAGTVEGSANSMKASWANLIAGLGDKNADLSGLISKFTDSLLAYVQNLVPIIRNVIQGLTVLIGQLVQELLPELLQILADESPALLNAGAQLVVALVQGLSMAAPQIATAATDALILIAQTLITPENLELVINSGVGIIVAVVSGLAKALPKLIPAVVQGILTIVKTLTSKDNLTAVLTAATQIIMAVCSGILSVLPELIPTILELFTTIVSQILDPTNLNNVLTSAMQIIMAVVSGLTQALPQLIPAVVSAITTITAELSKPENLLQVIQAAVLIIGAVVSGLIQALPELGAGLLQITGAIFESLGNLAKDAVTWGADMIKSFVKGIKDNSPSLGEAASGAAKKVKDFLGFSEPKDGPLSNFHTFAPDMMNLYAEGIDDNIGIVQNSVEDVAGVVAGGMTPQNDYSGILGNISGQLASAIGGGKQIVIPVYIGQERLDTLVVNAQNRANFLSGGR